MFFSESIFLPLNEIFMYHNSLLWALVEILIQICDTVNVVFFLGISLTSSLWVVAEFLQYLVYDWSQNFCDTLCMIMNGGRISATSSVWVVVEFLLHPVYEWSQNFCNTQCMNGRRISAHPLYKSSQNFCHTQCMSGRKFLQYQM